MEEVVASDGALQRAREWVENMTGGADPELHDKDDTPEMRPSRLGLGAKYLPHSQVTAAIHPVEKKLRAKLGISHHSAGYSGKTAAASDVRADSKQREFTHESNKKEDFDDDDNEDSRASTFKMKHVLNPMPIQGAGSKKKKKKQY